MFFLFALLGVLNVPKSIDYYLAFFVGVVFPLRQQSGIATEPRSEEQSFKIPILIILGVVAIRFAMDAFVEGDILRGPWKIAFVSGLYYMVYFSFHRALGKDNTFAVIKSFIYVSSTVSLYTYLQILFPSLTLVSGTVSEVGDSFFRYQSVYYHFSVLSLLLIAHLLLEAKLPLRQIVFFVILAATNFFTVLITGYRATLFVLLGCLGLYLLRFWKRVSHGTKLAMIVLLLPFAFYVYEYTIERNAETVRDEGDSSLTYRLLEAGLGLEKLAGDDSWIWGVGYADGFLNPWGGQVGGQETYFLHNGYISILYNYGLVGSAVWLAFIVTLLAYMIRHYRDNRTNSFYVLITLYLLGQLVVNFSSGVFNREPAAPFCFFFALVLLEKVTRYSKTMSVNWTPVPESIRRATI